VPGAVLLSLDREQRSRAWLREYRGLVVKNVRIPLFTVVCTKVFTLSPPKILKDRNFRNRNFKSSGGQTTETGGSDPTFSAFSRPKKFSGSLPPVGSDQAAHTTDPHHQDNFASPSQSQRGT
jgi:hypothetical protein